MRYFQKICAVLRTPQGPPLTYFFTILINNQSIHISYLLLNWASNFINLLDWSISEVKEWAKSIFNEEIAANFEKQEVDGQTLLDLTLENSWEVLGLTTIGKKSKFNKEILKLKGNISTWCQLNAYSGL